MTFGSVFGRTFSPTFQPSSQAAAVAGGWWLSGGIAAANCIAAYQPKGAANYAASKVNLANPGTYDAADGTAYPTWDATNGWEFLRASAQYLKTDIVANALTWTYIVRFSNYASNLTYHYIFGAYTDETHSNLYGKPGNEFFAARNGSTVNIANTTTVSGVHAMANKTVYWDGTYKATIPAGGAPSSNKIYIGAFYPVNASYCLTGYIQAIAIFNTELTTEQVGLLTTAMAAL